MADPMKKPDPSRTDSVRPPPLPKQERTPPLGSADRLGRAKAFAEIGWLRASGWLRRNRALAATVGAVVVLGGAAAIYVATEGVPEVDLELLAPATVAEARAAVRAHPDDPAMHRALGHALWKKGKRHAAVASYAKALSLDKGAADGDLVDHLVASFGAKDQDAAEVLIWKNKLLDAQPGLEALVKSPRRKVRWGAVRTLDKLEKGTKANWETAYILDLDAQDCDVRRNAVEKLGAIGTKRSVAALRSARSDDERTGGWFKSRCLGDRLDDAEQKILARR